MLWGNRYVPHKLLDFALFGEHLAISRMVDGVDVHIRLNTATIRRLLGIRAQATRLHLRWLNDRGYIRNLQLRRGRASFVCRLPSTYNWTGIVEKSA